MAFVESNSSILVTIPESLKAKFQVDFAPLTNSKLHFYGFSTPIKTSAEATQQSPKNVDAGKGKAVKNSSPVFRFISRAMFSSNTFARKRPSTAAPYSNLTEMFREMDETHSDICLLGKKRKFESPFQSECSALLDKLFTELGKRMRHDFRTFHFISQDIRYDRSNFSF